MRACVLASARVGSLMPEARVRVGSLAHGSCAEGRVPRAYERHWRRLDWEDEIWDNWVSPSAQSRLIDLAKAASTVKPLASGSIPSHYHHHHHHHHHHQEFQAGTVPMSNLQSLSGGAIHPYDSSMCVGVGFDFDVDFGSRDAFGYIHQP